MTDEQPTTDAELRNELLRLLARTEDFWSKIEP